MQIFSLLRHEKPLFLFSSVGILLTGPSLTLGIPIILEFFKTRMVPRLPTAILAMGVMTLACLAFLVGVILNTVSRGRKEMKLLAFLSIPPLKK